MTNTGTSLIVTTPATNTPDPNWYYYGQFGLDTPLTTGNIYRIKADLTAPGGAVNPSILLAFNARGTSGYAFTQINQGAANGPGTSASTWSGYLVPLENSVAIPAPQAQFIVFDGGPSTTVGGTVTASSIQVQSIALADVLASATSQGTDTSFAVAADGNASATEWGYFDATLGTGTLPTLTHTPANGASGPLVMSALTTTNAANIGFASFQGPTGSIPTTAGKLVLIRAKIQTSSSPTATMPTVWLNADSATVQAGLLIQRDNAGTSGPTSTPKDYYMVFEPVDATCTFNLRLLADTPNINGNIQMTELEVLEADTPSEP
jgi:hypothetical protein